VAKTPSPQKRLRLYTEQPPKIPRPQIEAVACMADLCRAFQEATGRAMRYESGKLKSDGDKDAAQRLAGTIAELLEELLQTRQSLWQREAELAAGVPLVPHRENEIHLAARLEAALRAGAEAVEGAAVALYLLDEATTELKLRSAWGLPFDRLSAPARPLQGALADLEALLGHAVVLDDSHAMRTWNMPEEFPAAVCVPVATPTMLLGTLWVFSNKARDFNDRQTNILEVVAGRIASDLEREMLLRSSVDGAKLQKQMDAAGRLQRNQLPSIAPLWDGWDVAGWTGQAEELGGAFHDWFCLPRGLLAVGAGKSAQSGAAGALTANVVRTAVRAHAQYHRQPQRLMQQVNLTLWTGSAGDQHASLFCGLIETASGRISCSSAGRMAAVVLHRDGWQSLGPRSPRLGDGPETAFEPLSCELQSGEAMVVFSDDASESSDAKNLESAVAEALLARLDLSAEELVATAGETISAQDVPGRDQTVLVIKRTA